MSALGEMTLFFGLHVKHDSRGILVHQGKYVDDVLAKFKFTDAKPAETPMEERPLLTKHAEGFPVDQHLYRSIIGSLMYLTASRPDIMFVVCHCVRYEANPKNSHLTAVKRIFRYLKVRPRFGLWYPRDSNFDLFSFSDSNFGGTDKDRKSTSAGCQFLGDRLISWQCKKQQTVAISTSEAEGLIKLEQIDTDANVANLFTKPVMDLKFISTHNQEGYLAPPPEKHKKLYTSLIKGLNSCRIVHALRENRVVYESLVQEFWKTARFDALGAGGKGAIVAEIQKKSVTVTEQMIREVL
ncbi:uncharacterized mitochondrial protein AtMg00810-like [Helianthus annuus]|uniref:uncharacterized mitochondrial protein AtMg00810-like n=1 Tax=Helianthus annuus TaxID=4232 RepID=UPI000B8F29D8|nr:uncharacterized mitochondrial protein AtMg00810-like [Helianthus annuus]